LKIKPNFSLIGKCFPLTNFHNSKQTQESLESGFPEITFQEINTPLILMDEIKKKIQLKKIIKLKKKSG